MLVLGLISILYSPWIFRPRSLVSTLSLFTAEPAELLEKPTFAPSSPSNANPRRRSDFLRRALNNKPTTRSLYLNLVSFCDAYVF